jgi:hypothetical protein
LTSADRVVDSDDESDESAWYSYYQLNTTSKQGLCRERRHFPDFDCTNIRLF